MDGVSEETPDTLVYPGLLGRQSELNRSSLSILNINRDIYNLNRGQSARDRYKIQFYDDSSFNIVDDFFEADRIKTIETDNAFEYIANLLGMEHGIHEVINLIADFLFDCFKTPRYSDEK